MLRTTVSALALSLGLCGSAMATTYTVTDVAAVYPDNAGIINVVTQQPPPWTTPMIFTTSGGQTFTTYCDDLGHDVFIEGGQSLLYSTGLVTTDGEGHSISEAISNVMGQIARLGLIDMTGGDMNGAIAANGAIWGLEYNSPVTSPNATIQADVNAFLTLHDDGDGYAQGLISLDGAQSQILPSGPPAPEASTWLMLLTGFAGLSFIGWRKRARA